MLDNHVRNPMLENHMLENHRLNACYSQSLKHRAAGPASAPCTRVWRPQWSRWPSSRATMWTWGAGTLPLLAATNVSAWDSVCLVCLSVISEMLCVCIMWVIMIYACLRESQADRMPLLNPHTELFASLRVTHREWILLCPPG